MPDKTISIFCFPISNFVIFEPLGLGGWLIKQEEFSYYMKKVNLIWILILMQNILIYGQNVNLSDSLKISITLEKLFDCFENPNYDEFKKISTASIFCTICDMKSDSNNSLIERKRFFNNYLVDIRNSETWKRVKNLKVEKYFNEPESNKKFSDITVFYTIWEENELAKGHAGAKLGINFIEVENEFKFAGLETIP